MKKKINYGSPRGEDRYALKIHPINRGKTSTPDVVKEYTVRKAPRAPKGVGGHTLDWEREATLRRGVIEGGLQATQRGTAEALSAIFKRIGKAMVKSAALNSITDYAGGAAMQEYRGYKMKRKHYRGDA